MGFSHSELFQDKEYLEAIHMVMDLKGIVPVVGTVLYKVNTEECTIEKSGIVLLLVYYQRFQNLVI